MVDSRVRTVNFIREINPARTLARTHARTHARTPVAAVQTSPKLDTALLQRHPRAHAHHLSTQCLDALPYITINMRDYQNRIRTPEVVEARIQSTNLCAMLLEPTHIRTVVPRAHA